MTRRALVATAVALLSALEAGCAVEPYCLTCRGGALDGAVDAAVDAPPVDALPMDARDAPAEMPDIGPAGDGGCFTSELCNGLDDDCDGNVDEGFNLEEDPRHCGGCGMVCGLLHAFPECNARVCAIERCDVGWIDLDLDPINGCEYRCTAVVGATTDVICDLRDDDCDGSVDEEVLIDSDPLNCGSCARTCATAHATSGCTAGTCVIATCDVGYYDLDGSDANGCEYACVPSTPTDEDCDARDDDCDGVVDEGNPGAGVACGIDTGECATGLTACMDGRIVCGGATEPTTETCDGTDEDCDGVVDNGNPGAGARCGSDVGRCVAGVQVCTAGAIVCTGAVGPATETCDGTDENCDGTVDDGDPQSGAACGNDGTGECTPGTEHCRGGTIACEGTVGPRAETCNMLDDDCDTRVDETFSFMTDIRNCGACGVTCAFANGIAACSAGACTLAACQSGFVNADMSAANGCEYACSFNGGEACNGRDDDCDTRTDEGVTRPANYCDPNGVCSGTEATCGGTSGWVCSYPATFEPSEVSCDGLDNDCDGGIDEPFAGINPLTGMGGACSVGTGACARTGTIRCATDGLSSECSVASPGTPAAEACNGVDDDCNGTIDDNIPLASIPTVSVPRTGGGTVRVMSYEASRADATSSSAGTTSRVACSRPNVVPWTTVTWAEASAACCALNAGGACLAGGVGWRLCDAPDWEVACEGPAGTCDWSYASACATSAPVTCNGEEHDCDSARAGDQDCLYATGGAAFPMCRTSWAVGSDAYDMSGNAREWTATALGSSIYEVRGGSFASVEAGRACDFDFTVSAAASAANNTGFRCCNYGP